MPLYQPLNEPQMTAYFGQLFPDRPGLRLETVKRSYPGMSRETWWITLAWDAAGGTAQEKFVVRLDPPGGCMSDSPLKDESEVYRLLHGTAVPVPRLIVHEDRPEWLLEGREFTVREWIEGEIEPACLRDDSEAGRAARIAIVKEQMDKLAAIHALDWRAMGFGHFLTVPSDPENCGREDVVRHLDMLDRHAQEPLPGLREIGRWLLENPPPAPARIVLRKENNGIGEEIWRDGRIVGMCDWEGASLGDPALDLAVAMGTTARYWGEEEALAYYNSVAPHPVTMEAVAWYRRFWGYKGACALHSALRNYNDHRDRRVQLLTLGCLYPVIVQANLSAAAAFGRA
ncbi:phosphotransferase family protein [Sphingopyxis sp. PET50]|uniref:phosphotransferase family protein n=1 Tax=Sphingopyxis sp. PET50 TaxID=2976533 RepID=UPI0021AFA367|nr:phosphotransferase family protein [Sphingopyxis sp. PET50]